MGASSTPRFRDANATGFTLKERVDSYGGVVVDRRGRMVAFWASFVDQRADAREFYGLPVDFLRPILEPLRRGERPVYRTLGVEVVPLGVERARDRGLSDARIRALLDHDDKAREVFEVLRIHGRAPAREHLRPTDLLLTVNGEPLTDARQLEALQQRPSVTLTVLRDAQEVTVEVETYAVSGRGVDRVVSWAGLILHEPHFEVQAQSGIEPTGLYIAWLWYGSPAQRYGLRPTRRIVEVDGVATPTLDAFLAAVATKQNREPVRLTLETDDGAVLVQTLKLDLDFWPTQILALDQAVWTRSAAADVTAAQAE